MDDLQQRLQTLETEMADFKNRVFANHTHKGGFEEGLIIETDQDMDINLPKDLTSVFIAGHAASYSSDAAVVTLTNPAASGKNLYIHGFMLSKLSAGQIDMIELRTCTAANVSGGTGLAEVNMRIGSAVTAVGVATYGSTLASTTTAAQLSMTNNAQEGNDYWFPMYSDMVVLEGYAVSAWADAGGTAIHVSANVVWREV